MGEYIPWKIRVQEQTIKNLLEQGTKNEKLQSESFLFDLRFVFSTFYRG